MYLKSLTLKGFKSFATSTTFAFEQGVTCVVGPNGSGKSNVVDALAWVMGEQGAKTLRGGKMEDVIFAGTATKGPLGRAEVTLTIDNSDGALPIEYTEVTIRRTLFRNGGSEYAINGENCRLLDVQELLSDSGLGREMHVIVGQGQLDAVLRASPEDRRGFIEEAAGILKHRRRKEKTQRKLESMQANLTRLSDLAGEIRRQLKPLGAQAEVAREAQSIQARVRDARARLLADEVVELRTALIEHARVENDSNSERGLLQEQLEERTARIADLEVGETGDDVDRARRVAFSLESVQERLRSLFTLANQRLALLGSTEDAPAAAPSVTPQTIADARDEVVRLGGLVQAAETALQNAQGDFRGGRAALDLIDEDIATQGALLSRYDLDLSQLAGRADAAASRLAGVRGEVLRAQNALDAAAERRDVARARFTEVEADAALDVDGDDLDEAHERAADAVQAIEEKVEALRDELHQRERERDALQARVSALTLALDASGGSAVLASAGVRGVSGLVADGITVRDGWETAIAAALGTLTEAALADGMDAALDGLRHAGEHGLGQVEVVIGSAALPTIASAGASPDPRVDGVSLVSATSVVSGPTGVLALLDRVQLVDDLDGAKAALAALRGEYPAVTLVTRTGDVLTPQLLRGGSGEANRIELVAQRDSAAERLEAATHAVDRLKFTHAEQRADLVRARDQESAALSALRELDATLSARTESISRLRVQVDAATSEHERLARALADATARVTDVEAAADSARSAHEAARSAPRPSFDATRREPAAAAVESAREREIGARLALETARERVRAESARIGDLERQLEADRIAAEAAARRAVIRRRQIATATSVAESLPAILDSVDRSVSSARLELAEAEAQRSVRNQELVTLRRGEADLRARLAVLTETVHGTEIRIHEKKLQLHSLLERAGAYGLDERLLVAEYGPTVPIPTGIESGDADSGGVIETRPYVRAEQQKRLAEGERALAQLGRVNPLALEEFAALEQRHAFLIEQLNDLTSTRKDLLTIIDELDVKMQTIFLDAFEDTKAAFDQVFPILFPGGSGSIELTSHDEPLLTGIEVTVRPVGKKIERLSLLSGGERSLAAVALLIAIFKARPSPFYIMDEVEAALDDANLGRLLTIFEDLRQNSQLIVITHQKRTMEIADALYGVSMRQDGISAVVGQRIGRDEPAE
ncbi:chromosome segregation protein SMC [Naasia lichenicola]|uniref:Chromosome partition protein Smc n=1 Tax=Naasia lichenicola TaxID=2565933 RepID=A0A4S4FQR5_9MICO|nr:chromosome segregation protein SMC [Naasia lichenicola]THG31756.1 chromosome segregation protein SMC [Naasia lichenicola]